MRCWRQLQHRLSHGINVSASYTFSKALDASDAYSSAVDPFLDPRSRNYGPAGFDRAMCSQQLLLRPAEAGKGTGYPAAGLGDG